MRFWCDPKAFGRALTRHPVWHMGWRILPGMATALAIAGLFQLDVLQPLEQMAYRSLFHLRGERSWDDRLVLIAIDDQSLQQLGRFPWSRSRYVTLLDQLSANPSSIVVFDLLWSESSPEDAELAAAIQQHGRVVLSQAWAATSEQLSPVPLLAEGAIATGHIQQQQSSDGIVRTIVPYIEGEPALYLAAAQAYSLVAESVPQSATDEPLWVNWPAHSQQLPTYSFVDVYQGNVPPQAWNNKIVLVGVTATGIDELVTPFDYDPPVSSVYLHAAALTNLLQQNWLKPMPQVGWALILLVGGPGLSWLMTGCSTRKQFGMVTGLSASWGILSLSLFRANYLLPVATPLILFSATAIAIALIERLRESQLLQQQVEQLWSLYEADLIGSTGELALPTDQWSEPSFIYRPVSLWRITQLSAIAQQLGRAQSTQTAIANSLSVGLVAAHEDERIWFLNAVAANCLQAKTGQDLASCLVPNWLSAEEWCVVRRQLRLGTQTTHVKEVYRNDHWYELQFEPLHYPLPSLQSDEKLILNGWLLLIKDISDRKQIETNLNRQIEEQQQLNVMKDDFLSTVSHELRSPMANIKMAIQLLELAQTPEQHARYLEILRSECDRETDLINDLLDLQRLEAGAKDLMPEPILIPVWLPHIAESFQGRIQERQQILEVDCPDNLPSITTDRLCLERVLGELIHNACKYTPPEECITVRAMAKPKHLIIQVQNSGSEIPEAELPRIFDKFYRVASGDRWQQGGTGLGLALIKKLTELLGGDIHVTSRNSLTTFTVQLPQKPLE